MGDDPISRINRICDKLAGDPDEDIQLFGEYLRETGGRGTLHDHIGITNARGHDALRELAYAQRNAAFCKASRLLGNGLSPRDCGKILANRLHRYYEGQWQHDRFRSSCPYPAGSLNGLLWTALKAVDRDVARRQMRRILG